MNLPLSKLEILLTTALVCTLIGFCYMAFFRESDAINKLANVINECNAIHEVQLINNCQPLPIKEWNILDYINSTGINQTIKDNNLTIYTASDRAKWRLNTTGR